MRRDFDEHVDVIARQRAGDDRHAHFSADLLDNLANSGPDLAVEHLEPVLGRPDDMGAMMKCRVATGGIADSGSVAEASIRLKSEQFLPKRDSKLARTWIIAMMTAQSSLQTGVVKAIELSMIRALRGQMLG